MILLDSNIVIYLRDPNIASRIVDKLNNQTIDTCNIVVAEVLGFRELTDEDTSFFRQLFVSMRNYPFNETVTNKTIEIRRLNNVQLPDAIIAATAIINNLTLWTHNIADFKDIPQIRLFDPLT